MGFNDLEYHTVNKEVKAFVESIHELDIVYNITDQTIDIGELHPVWRGETDEARIQPSARITYVRKQKVWKLYWMRTDLKWHLYAETDTLHLALETVKKDAQCCFFG